MTRHSVGRAEVRQYGRREPGEMGMPVADTQETTQSSLSGRDSLGI